MTNTSAHAPEELYGNITLHLSHPELADIATNVPTLDSPRSLAGLEMFGYRATDKLVGLVDVKYNSSGVPMRAAGIPDRVDLDLSSTGRAWTLPPKGVSPYVDLLRAEPRAEPRARHRSFSSQHVPRQEALQSTKDSSDVATKWIEMLSREVKPDEAKAAHDKVRARAGESYDDLLGRLEDGNFKKKLIEQVKVHIKGLFGTSDVESSIQALDVLPDGTALLFHRVLAGDNCQPNNTANIPKLLIIDPETGVAKPIIQFTYKAHQNRNLDSPYSVVGNDQFTYDLKNGIFTPKDSNPITLMSLRTILSASQV